MMEIERNLFAILPSLRSARQEFNFLSAIYARTMNLCAKLVGLSCDELPRVKKL